MKTDWQPGRRIEDRWEVRAASEQGFCLVYRVYDHEQRKVLILKTPNPELLVQDPQLVRRFGIEGAAWTQYPPHQNVVGAAEICQIDSRTCLVHEHVPGWDLTQIQEKQGRTMGTGFAIEAGIQLCRGLHHLFRHGLNTHRDIKPRNCVVNSSKILKIFDVGLAKALDGAGPARERRGFWGRVRAALSLDLTLEQRLGNTESDMTLQVLGPSRAGLIGGTPAYLAPEVFDGPANADVRSDIYAFGVLLFQLLLGRLPFEGKTWREMERLHRSASLPALDGADPELADLLATCMASDRKNRYPDFKAVERVLTAIYERGTGRPFPPPAMGPFLEASQLLDQAAALREAHLSTEAVNCYDRVIEVDPANRTAWFERGNLSCEKEEYDEALACYDRALATEPDYLPAWSAKGYVLMKQQQATEALHCFDQAIALAHDAAKSLIERGLNVKSSGLGRSLLLKGNLLMETGRYQESLQYFDEAHRIYGEKGALLGMMLCRHESPQPESNQPPDAKVEEWVREGCAAAKQGRFDEAIRYFDHGLNVAPRSARLWFHKAVALMELGRLPEVVTCAGRAVELEPTLSAGWTALACSFMKLSRLEEAAVAFQNALEVDSRAVENWTLLGMTLATLERFDEALKAFDEALKARRHDGFLWLNKGLALRNLNRIAEAMQCFQIASQLGDARANAALKELGSAA